GGRAGWSGGAWWRAGAESPPRNRVGGAGWDAGAARGAAGGAGRCAGGAVRDWDQGAGDERAGGEGAGDERAGDDGASRVGARTGMAGAVRPAAGWPFPGYPPAGPGTLDRGLPAPPLGWLRVPGDPLP